MIKIHHADDIRRVLSSLPDDNYSRETNEHPSPDFTISVRYMRAQSSGETVCVGIELADRVQNVSEQRRYTLQTALFSALNLHRGLISQEKLCEIEQAATLSAAWSRGLNILSYGANSAGALTMKLRRRGYDAETAERAVAIICAQGYLREDSDARREAERCLGKGWGPRRIGQHLRSRGYDGDAVTAALETLADEDFGERCCCVARKYQRTPPEDAKQKQKIIAYLLRYGYAMDDIRYALSEAWNDET